MMLPRLKARSEALLRSALPWMVPTHFRDQAVRQLHDGLLPLSLGPQRWLSRQLWCDYRVLIPLQQPVVGRQVCLFAMYDRDGIVDDYVLYYLSKIQAAGMLCVLVATRPFASKSELKKAAPFCAAIIERENIGLDFGSWRTALLIYPELYHCQTLIFANDSVYGPMRDLGEITRKMLAAPCDFWGITESFEVYPHYQSYFLGFKRSALDSQAFIRFQQRIALLADKRKIIDGYEIGLVAALRRGGLWGQALVPGHCVAGPQQNPTLHRWRETLAAGSPFLKVQLLRENPHQQQLSDWPAVVASYGYDPALIERHLRRFR